MFIEILRLDCERFKKLIVQIAHDYWRNWLLSKKVAQVPGALIVQEIVLENYFKE